MSNIVNRRRMIKQLAKESKDLSLTSIEEMVEKTPTNQTEDMELNIFNFEQQELTEFLSMDNYLNIDTSISEAKIVAQVEELRKRFDKENASQFFNESRDQLLGVILNRFMLGGIVANSDRDGGNVDTIHNVRQTDEKGNLTYASDDFKNTYNNRGAYNSDDYHKDSAYKAINSKYSSEKKAGSLDDSYTGNRLKRNANVDLDHTISSKEVHDDPGRVLAEMDGPGIANTDSNLNPTDRSINRSKQQASTDDFLKRLEQTEQKRLSKIQELKNKESLTDKERKELHKLEQLQDIDKEKMKQLDEKARKEYNAALNMEYYLSKKFLGNVGKTSLKEGAKMGFQQVIGLFLTETIAAVFDEIRDYCKKGAKAGESFWKELKGRLEKVVKRVSAKWKEALSQGLSGTLSGIFSNILTVIINTVITTAKNMVRLIREGFFSLVKAVKLLLNPPENMTKAQVFHEAGKIIIGAVGVSIGILLEETVDKFPPMKAIRSIPVIGELLYSTIFGLMTALMTAFGLWGWDKMDLFGVKETARHDFVISILKQDHQLIIQERTEWLDRIKESDPERYMFLRAELSF